MLALEARVVYLEGKVIDIEKELLSNSATTTRIEKNTIDLVNMFTTAKGVTKWSVRFGIWVGKVLKWAAGIAVAVMAIWSFIQSVLTNKPPGPH